MSLRSYIESWRRTLSQRRMEFGGMPTCPCAKGAHMVCVTAEDSIELNGLLILLGEIPPNSVLVIEVARPQGALEVLRAHRGSLADRNMLALPSDPLHPTEIAGVLTTQLERFLVLVQNKSELEASSKRLAETGYYKNWSLVQRAWLEDRQ